MPKGENFFLKNKSIFYAASTVTFSVALILIGLLFYVKYKKNKLDENQLKEEVAVLKEKLESQNKDGYGVNLEGNANLGLQPTDSPNNVQVPLNASPINMDSPGQSMGANGSMSNPGGLMPGSGAAGQPGGQQPAQAPAEAKPKVEETDVLKPDKWKTYENDKYKYSFDYPHEFNLGECSSDPNPCKLGKIIETEGGNTVDLSSSFESQTWPKITFTHLESTEYQLPEDKKLIDWVKEKFPSVASEMPKTYNISIKSKSGNPKKGLKIKINDGTAAATDSSGESEKYHYEIYVEKDGKIFKINLQGIDGQKAKDFYDDWLDEVRL